jgi:ubiquinone/menaquinone biosynthesis C-methylase UbiE
VLILKWSKLVSTHFPANFYAQTYRYFHHPVYQQVRRETYRNEDIGQSGWLTKEEFLQFLAWIAFKPRATLLDIGSGSGGPALFVAQQFHSSVVGIERNEYGVATAKQMVDLFQLQGLVQFQLADVVNCLPFDNSSFDSIVCIDALGLVHTRLHMFKEWHRILKDGGYALFTDQVLTGLVSSEEVIMRSRIGPFSMTSLGHNERLLSEANLELLRCEDVTENVVVVSERWYCARQKQALQLIEMEGETFWEMQQYLTVVHMLAHERRLSRYVFVARKMC